MQIRNSDVNLFIVWVTDTLFVFAHIIRSNWIRECAKPLFVEFKSKLKLKLKPTPNTEIVSEMVKVLINELYFVLTFQLKVMKKNSFIITKHR